MNQEYVEHARGFSGLIGIAREDITPPVGIFAKCWGAATECTATGIDMPLTLTALAFSSAKDPEQRFLLIAIDGPGWHKEQEYPFRRAVCEANGLNEDQVVDTLSHTHAAVPLTGDNEGLPGGDLVIPYIGEITKTAVRTSQAAFANQQPASLEWRSGHCNLAANRDFQPDPGGDYAVGYNPAVKADTTVMVGRILDGDGKLLATLVNYACHATTLAWGNRLLSPDYVGPMREVVENTTNQKPCCFIQGACGNLAPRHQYVGDPEVARRNGRQLGYAVLSTLATFAEAPSRLVFKGFQESGTRLALWYEEPDTLSTQLSGRCYPLKLGLKEDFPTIPQLKEVFASSTDPVEKERFRRRMRYRRMMGEDSPVDYPVWFWRLGNSIMIGFPGEAYSDLQTSLRRTFPDISIIIMCIVNGTFGYLPQAEYYDKPGCYTAWQSPFAPGCHEALLNHCIEHIEKLFPGIRTST